MSNYMIKWTLGLLAVGCMLAMAGPASAELLGTKAPDAFDRMYDMDLEPSDENLDGIGGMDFSKIMTLSGSIVHSATEGTVTISRTATSGRAMYNSAAGQIWREDDYNLKSEGGYTYEFRVKVSGSGEAIQGSIVFQINPSDTEEHPYLCVGTDGMYWNEAQISTTTNGDDAFHTFRVAAEYDEVNEEGIYHVWRDGDLVGDATRGPSTYYNDLNRFLFGHTNNNTAGAAVVDYVCFTEGAYAPVPEPSTLMLLLGGLLSLVLWRRR